MKEEIEFRSKEELFKRIRPALYSKVKEARRLGYKYVTEKDVWNYLVDNKWKKQEDFELHDMINDILYVDNYSLNEFTLKERSKYDSKIKINEIKDDDIL